MKLTTKRAHEIVDRAMLGPQPKLLAFTVPGVPVPCGRARVERGTRLDGSTFVRGRTPDRTRGYESLVADHARLAANRARWAPPSEATFAVTIDVYRARRVGDWDNYGKAVADALTRAGVWPDDRYVQHAFVSLWVDKVRPRVEVVVRWAIGGMH